MRFLLNLVLALLGELWGSTATAQSPPSQDCELDVFSPPLITGPGKKTAFVHILGSSDDPFAWVNLSAPTAHLSRLSDDEIRGALGLPGSYRVVRHTDAPITKEMRKSATPLTSPSTACHAELLAYEGRHLPGEKSKYGGREEFATLFLYREFSPGGIALQFDGMGSSTAEQFRQTLKTSRDKALADLHTASLEMLAYFGRKVERKRAALRPQ
ncbi:MAG: hypothetical protein QOJ94_1067 [Sphingomonadales bacterium]|jgi:hypothetical protein|nr:hypothetical protein [Sphingomonadales bacterium]